MTATLEAGAYAGMVRATLPVAFTPQWDRIEGITVDGTTITIEPDAYFFRYSPAPSWVLCDWEKVCDELLPATETADVAVEQMALDYVRANGRRTSDPAEVLATAWHVYEFLFRDSQLDDPGLSEVASPAHLRMLREAATLMALNRVAMDGSIDTIGPCWFFAAAVRVSGVRTGSPAVRPVLVRASQQVGV